jgi:hypothetical protein
MRQETVLDGMEGIRVGPRSRFGSARAVGLAMGISLASCAAPTPPTQLSDKSALEMEKLRLEVKSLRSRDIAIWDQSWFSLVVGILTGAAGTAASFLAARRARLGGLDEKVHEKRLELYPRLVGACRQLAVYFPDYTLPSMKAAPVSLTPDHCAAMGRNLSKWYFEDGGLLLSKEARDCYFALARALTGAADAPALAVPIFPDDAKMISDLKMDDYRRQLNLLTVKEAKKGKPKQSVVNGFDLALVDSWTFGPAPLLAPSGPQDAGAPSPNRFRDYVRLQLVSSRLRSTLAEDLRSRRRPS